MTPSNTLSAPPAPTGAAAWLRALEQRLGPSAPTTIMSTLPWVCNTLALLACVAGGAMDLSDLAFFVGSLPLLAVAILALRRWCARRGVPESNLVRWTLMIAMLPGVYVSFRADDIVARSVLVMMAAAPMAYGVFSQTTGELLRVSAFLFAAYLIDLLALQRWRPHVLSQPGDLLVGVALVVVCLALSLLCGHIYGLRRRLDQRSTALRTAMAQLSELAMRDELTGLPNRRSLMQQLQAALATGAPCSIAIVDVDHFKRVNDTWGHHVGDEVLRRLAKAAAEAVAREPGGVFGRHGGEEFLLLLPGHDARSAQAPVARLHATLGTVDFSDVAPALKATASVGLATRRAGEGEDALLAAADAALYRAKAEGRNRVCRREEAAA